MKLRSARTTFFALAVLYAAGSCAPRRATEIPVPRVKPVHEVIRDLLTQEAPALDVPDTADVIRAWEQVRVFYDRRHERPAWSNGRTPGETAGQLARVLAAVDSLGLDPREYGAEVLARLLDRAQHADSLTRNARNQLLARLDVRATFAYLRLAPHLARGQVPASVLDPDWSMKRPVPDWREHLTHALESRDVTGALEGLEPTHAGYRRLRAALAGYRGIAGAGGWPQLTPGPPLALGDSGPRVAQLIHRLVATGDLRGPHAGAVFDRAVQRAVGDFQSRHGIPRSGIAGEATRAALDVPVEARMHLMALNLERWRWLPDSLGARHIVVNIPAYRLDLVRGEGIERSFRVVVGRKRSPTPVFSDVITYLELNPTWTLPKSIVVKEMIPEMKRHRDYLATNHMHVISISSAKRDSVDPAKVPWKDAASDSFLYLVIQEAGPDNPLGRLKLMCPNEYDVYLHDTPTREKFGVAVRDFSHGCVRVAQTEELADSLIGRAPGDSGGIEALLADTRWRRLRLAHPMPVHFLYWTAWVDDSNRVQFRDDLYRLDVRLDSVLRVGAPDSLKLNPGVGVSPFWLAAEAAAARDAAARARARTVTAGAKMSPDSTPKPKGIGAAARKRPDAAPGRKKGAATARAPVRVESARPPPATPRRDSSRTAESPAAGGDAADRCRLVAKADVVIFTRPNASSDIFGTLGPRDTIIASARAAGGWIGFDPASAQAANVGVFRLRWVREDQMALQGRCRDLPVVEAPPAKVCFEMFMEATAVHAAPDSSSPVVVIARYGDYAALTGKRNGWLRVDLAQGNLGIRRTGWIPREAANVNGPCDKFLRSRP